MLRDRRLKAGSAEQVKQVMAALTNMLPHDAVAFEDLWIVRNDRALEQVLKCKCGQKQVRLEEVDKVWKALGAEGRLPNAEVRCERGP